MTPDERLLTVASSGASMNWKNRRQGGFYRAMEHSNMTHYIIPQLTRTQRQISEAGRNSRNS